MSAAVLLKIQIFCVIYSASSAKQLPTFRRIVLLSSLGSSSPRTNTGTREDQDILRRQGCACGLKRRVAHEEQNETSWLHKY